MLLMLIACESPYDAKNDTGPGATGLVGQVAPAFSLEDVNPGSATVGESLSPGYFGGQVSAWYFGHAT